MGHVSCGVSSCANNKSGDCFAGVISVGGQNAVRNEQTCCGSYISSTAYSNFGNFTSQNSETDYIACDANTCKHNASNQCTLSNINVGASNAASNYYETECLSFEK